MNRIAVVYVRSISPVPSSRPLTLLYSHSNGMDIGYCAGYLAFLSRRFFGSTFCVGTTLDTDEAVVCVPNAVSTKASNESTIS